VERFHETLEVRIDVVVYPSPEALRTIQKNGLWPGVFATIEPQPCSAPGVRR